MRTGILGFQSARLKQLRASTGMTQAKLAELLSCSTSNISKWEKGDSFPESSSFKKICETFSVPENGYLNHQSGPELIGLDSSDPKYPLVEEQKIPPKLGLNGLKRFHINSKKALSSRILIFPPMMVATFG